MKTVITIAAIYVALFFFFSNGSANADGDLGETSVVVSACHFAQSLAEAAVYEVRRCRIAGPVEYRHGGRSALVPVRLRADGRWISLTVFMEKSLWYGSAVMAR